MGAKTELHQRFCFREARHGEAVVGLVAPHCLARLIVPSAIRICAQIACLNQGLLDFLNALRFRAQLRASTPCRGNLRSLGRNVPFGRAVRRGVLACGGWGLMSSVAGGRMGRLLGRASAFVLGRGVGAKL